MKEQKTKKQFIAFPVRAIRMSNKTWKQLKDKKNRSGLSWNLFLLELIKKTK